MIMKPVIVADIVDNVRRIFQVLTQQSWKVESETSLTGPQLWVIKILKEAGAMKVSELARRMYLHPATMVGLLDRLEVKGLIKRERSEKDRRVVFINLTEQGFELERKSPEVVQNLLVKGLETLLTEDLKLISDGLDQVVTILGVENEPPKLIMTSETNVLRRRKKLTADVVS
ncbi:MAG: MarR family transcriptional regulator [Desulfuromonadaceae bacterium]|nr:MarR family transcriptional regulator [Desulfuromonadaceae bacterium]